MHPVNSNPAQQGQPSATPAPLPVPLSQLADGERGWLAATELCCEDCELLNAMGMVHQCEIRVCQRGNPGRPCIVQVNSTRLGLSAALAGRILVQRSDVTGQKSDSLATVDS